MGDFPSLEDARTQEAQRRLMLLGPFAEPGHKYDHAEFGARARHVMVSRADFQSWYDAHKAKGLEGLKPAWEELPEHMKEAALRRLSLLGSLATSEFVSVADLYQLADTLPPATNGNSTESAQTGEERPWSVHSIERWLRRFRKYGLWGLAKLSRSSLEQGALTKEKSAKRPKRDLGALDEAALEEMYRRRELLGDLANKKKVTREDVQDRAREVGVGTSTLWDYLRAYREYGLKGLAPAVRSDKGSYHIISARVVNLVMGIRLHLPSIPESRVHEIACEKAQKLGEIEPTASQVRSICVSIPEPLKLLSKGRDDQFRNKYQITYPIIFETVVYQIDIKDSVPVMLIDKRAPKYRTKTGEFRPYLIICIESNSRLIVGWRFTYDYPDRFDVASVLRDALRKTEKKPFGGKPDELRVDNGLQFVAGHIKNFCKDVKGEINLHICDPNDPKEKARVERFIETVDTRLWSELDGYVGPNLAERNPKAKAKLTLKELVAKFAEFIDKYHAEVHSATGQTPPEYFHEHCYAPPVDDRELDMLLKEKLSRVVLKEGIKNGNKVFWHADLAYIVGERVDIRADASYEFSDEIEVFYRDEWLCTAIDQKSEAGRAVTQAMVGAAQVEQSRYLRGKRNEALKALDDADREIEAKARSGSEPAPNLRSLPEAESAPGGDGDTVLGSDVGGESGNVVVRLATTDIPVPESSNPPALASSVRNKTSTHAKPARPKEGLTYLQRLAAQIAAAEEGSK